MSPMPSYPLRVAAYLSQGLNLLLGGHHDMTLSARCYVLRLQPGWRHAYRAINAIVFWQTDHCLSSFLDDVDFAKWVTRQGGMQNRG